jgi:hypothetical protein
MAYTMIFFPRRGAKVPGSTRRFGTNHGVLYSYLLSRARNAKIPRFTLAGQGAMLDGMNPKTVYAILQDLKKCGLIAWDGFVLKVEPLTNDHMLLFEPSPSQKDAQPLGEPPAASLTEYQMRNDPYDEYRALCKGLMPQADAEEAIAKAKLLSDDVADFETHLDRAKEQHRRNILKGKVGQGNFGAYFNKRMQTRLDEHEKAEKEWERQEELHQYYASPEFKQSEAEEMEKAKGDPTHRLHHPSKESILDRVSFPDDCTRRLESLRVDLRKHCRHFVEGQHLPLQEEMDLKSVLPDRVMKAALAKLNHYYGRGTKGTPEELAAAIDEALAQHGAPAFPFFPVVPQAKPLRFEKELERMEFPAEVEWGEEAPIATKNADGGCLQSLSIPATTSRELELLSLDT